MKFVDPQLENYCINLSTVPSEECAAIQRHTLEHVPMAMMLTGPLEGSFLQFLIRAIGAKRVLEFGTFTGYSALAMAEALPEDGEVVTLDINPETNALAASFWKKSPHGRKIRAVLGKAADSFKTLPGSFDLVFIDADKPGYIEYLELALPRLSEKGMIVADNTLFSGQVLDPQSDNAKAIVRFNNRVREDKSLITTLLPVRDGMLLIQKR